MNAMVMEAPGKPLNYRQVPVPEVGPGQLLLKVIACGICRTDLHILDGELAQPKLPLIPGHEIIARVVILGSGVSGFKPAELVGVAWMGGTCGHCKYCSNGRENLCDNASYTGYTIDGGYAEYTVAMADYCYKLEEKLGQAAFAPLLCAGLIGYRSYSMVDKGASNIGIYGFGAAAHILTQIAVARGQHVFAFTRQRDDVAQRFARNEGACWAGDSGQLPPERLDAAIIFAPAGELLPKALEAVDKGGVVICGGIHMTDIPAFPYRLLWEERLVRSVANLTRADGHNFFKIISRIPVQVNATIFPLQQANEALRLLRNGQIQGAAVLVMD